MRCLCRLLLRTAGSEWRTMARPEQEALLEERQERQERHQQYEAGAFLGDAEITRVPCVCVLRLSFRQLRQTS